MPVHTDVCTEVRDTKNLSEVVAAADAMLEGLINYLTNPIAVETVETNIGSEVGLDGQFSDKENEIVQPIEANVVINEAGIRQPLKSIGGRYEMNYLKVEKEMIIFRSQI